MPKAPIPPSLSSHSEPPEANPPIGPQRQSGLYATVRERLVLQIALAHHDESGEAPLATDARVPPTAAEVAILARLATSQELPAAVRFIDWLGDEGVSLEVILLSLIGPAARLLADQWHAGEVSFTEFAQGMDTIEKLVGVARGRIARP